MHDYIHFGGGSPSEELINKICGQNNNYYDACYPTKGITGPTGPRGPRETLFYAQHY